MRVVVFIGLTSLALLTACPPTGVVCQTGTEACGAGCIDPQNDKRNCGGCGKACGQNEECNAGTCGCQAGTTSCNGQCVVLDTDAKHCGRCDVACATGEVCEQGTCKVECTLGTNIRCGTACVNPTTDVANCGGCGVACASGQVCRDSKCTYDVVAACFSTGQVIGLNATSFSKGTLSILGSAPQSLAVMNRSLLSVDGFDSMLYQGRIDSTGINQTSSASRIGAVGNQVIVDGTTAFVVNAGTGTLQILSAASDAGVVTLDAGVGSTLALGTVSEVSFGMNAWPQAVVKVGENAWVTLFGGSGDQADAGQAVAKVSVGNAGQAAEVSRVDLRGLDLHAFDGGAPVARPFAITARNGIVYATLENLNPATWSVEGPGLLARIDSATSAASVVGLGANCLNPQWISVVNGKLAVSCSGSAQYNSNFDVVGVTGAEVVLVDETDTVIGTWSAQCPADAGTLDDGGVACPPMVPGRFAVRGSRLLVGDVNTGRIVVLDASDAGLSEVRGVTNPVTTCPARNVADLVTLP